MSDHEMRLQIYIFPGQIRSLFTALQKSAWRLLLSEDSPSLYKYLVNYLHIIVLSS